MGDESLDVLYQNALHAGHDKVVTAWRYRYAKARARQSIATSQLQRLVARETAGLDVDTSAIHEVEQELADAAGAAAFCEEMVRAPAVAPKPATPATQLRPVPQQQATPKQETAK